METNEVWKSIKDYPNYQISNFGNIRNNKKNKLMTLTLANNGYYVVNLCHKVFLVHRLVALSFLENKENKRCVNHINCIKSDNRIENIEWVTDKENMEHAVSNGLINNCEDVSNSKLTNIQVKEIRLKLKKCIYQKEIAIIYEVSQSCISLIKNYKTYNNLI